MESPGFCMAGMYLRDWTKYLARARDGGLENGGMME